MKVIQRGHIYELATKEGKTQLLTFFKDLPHGAADNHDGVLCQEVLRALIDRVNELHQQMPCVENVEIVQALRRSLLLFEVRAAGRSLEKCYAKTGLNIEQLPTQANGHVFQFVSVKPCR